jgi:hypothetical protein
LKARRRIHPWPLAIVIGLLIMVAVNVGFMLVAIGGSDEIVPSYHLEER